MPLPLDSQEVFVHTFVGIKEARYKPDLKDPSFQIIPLAFEVLKIVNLVNIVIGGVHTHLFIKGIYTT